MSTEEKKPIILSPSAGGNNPGLALATTTPRIYLRMTPESCRRSRRRRLGSGDLRVTLLLAVGAPPERAPGLRTRETATPAAQGCAQAKYFRCSTL